MFPAPIRIFIAWRFNRYSLYQMTQDLDQILDNYSIIVQCLNEDQLQQIVKVPKSTGINEKMQNWSILMILEHNIKVNELIQHTVTQLAHGKDIKASSLEDIRAQVMPSEQKNASQITEDFKASVLCFTKLIETELVDIDLKNTKTSQHMLFGDFNAHQWARMFVFHLKIHLKQARQVQRKLS